MERFAENDGREGGRKRSGDEEIGRSLRRLQKVDAGNDNGETYAWGEEVLWIKPSFAPIP